MGWKRTTFTAAEDETIITLRGSGTPYRDINKVLPHRSASVIRYRHTLLLKQHEQTDLPLPTIISRLCLRCRTPFQAPGRFVRLCRACNHHALEASSSLDFDEYPVSPRNTNPDNV